MNRLRVLQTQLQALIDQGKAFQAAESLSEDDAVAYGNLPEQIDAKRKEISDEQAAATRLNSALGDAETFLNGDGQLRATVVGAEEAYKKAKTQVRGRAGFFSMLPGVSREEANLKALGLAHFMMASLKGSQKSKRYCMDNGIPLMRMTENGQIFAGHSESDSESGAALIPPEYEQDMIVLREMFGVFRKYARNTPMASDVKSRPRRKGGLTAYHTSGGDSVTESKAQWDIVQLVAKKIMVFTRYESELGEDAYLNMGDTLFGEIAYAFAKTEDTDGFTGTGISTNGGIVGVGQRLIDAFTTSGGTGLIQASAAGWSGILLGDFVNVVAALPQYAEAKAQWYCHKTFYHSVIEPIILLAGGGTTSIEIMAGVQRRFLGYDVVISQVMPNATAASQVPIYFGDLAMAADFGDRRQTTLALSDQYLFNTDELAIRGTERYDINVHDVGVSGTAGPMTGLVTK